LAFILGYGSNVGAGLFLFICTLLLLLEITRHNLICEYNTKYL